MDTMTLDRLLANLKDLAISGSPALPVADITNDSRQVKPGSVFIAVPGYSQDGHKFIQDAVRAGAAAVVAQHPTAGITVPQIIVENTRKAQAELAAEFYGHPSKELKITGVTGTNGKTTSTFMIDSILQAAHACTGVMGTLYNKVNGNILPTVNTTPDSIVSQRLLRDMVSAGVSHVSMEVSSHAMVMHRVDAINFTVGAITNFSPDHLDLHKNMAEYMRAKQSFFELLPAESFAVVNLDEPATQEIAASTKATPLFYSMTNPQADIYMLDFQRRGDGAVITAKLRTRKIPIPADTLYFYLGVAGRHNIANALLAAATALALGVDMTAIAKGLGNFRGIFRRYEVIYNGRFRVIDDATHNPANMEAVFRAISAEKPQGLSIVYAIRGSRGVKINRSIAQTLHAWALRIKPLRLIVTSCSDTASSLDQVSPEEEQVFREELAGLDIHIEFIDTLRQAVSLALDTVRQGETLLFMGAHPMDNVSEVFSELAGVQTTTLPRPPRFGVH